GEGVSDTGCKKDLIERLVRRVVSKTKDKNRLEGSSQSSGSWFKEGDAAWLACHWIELIDKVQNVAATRAFMLKVANKKGWNMASEIRDPFNEDPIEAYFQERWQVPTQPVHSGFALVGAPAYRSSISNP
ncbi:32831_t:CDS:2, partial [Gigaspora margarita]